MKRKVWFYLFWTQLVLSLVVCAAYVCFDNFASEPAVKETDIGAYLAERKAYEDKYGESTFEQGYIPDARTAERIGGAIIDSMCKRGWCIGEGTEVEYDPVNRLWKVQKGYVFPRYYGGIVVLEQDTGEVLHFVKQK